MSGFLGTGRARMETRAEGGAGAQYEVGGVFSRSPRGLI